MKTTALLVIATAIIVVSTVSALLPNDRYIALLNFAMLLKREITERIEYAVVGYVAVLAIPALMAFGGHGGGLLTRFRWGVVLVGEILLAAAAVNLLANNDNQATFLYCLAMYLFAGLAYLAAWSKLGEETIKLIRSWKDVAILERILLIIGLPTAVFVITKCPLLMVGVLK